jgi:hypothetical protein
MSFDDIPDTGLERVRVLENLLVARATGDLTASDQLYGAVRRELMADARLKRLLPEFVRTCRTLDVFWPYIKGLAGTYADRRKIIGEAFTPIVDFLEGADRSPGDAPVSDTLQSFDVEGVHLVWEKALQRRASDPEGAITLSRTLLETVCKRILDAREKSYSDKEDLPKLYGMVAKELSRT